MVGESSRIQANQLKVLKERLSVLKRQREELVQKMTNRPKEARQEDQPGEHCANPEDKSKKEVREEEDAAAIGGLRDPPKAVANSKTLRTTGHRIRQALELSISDKDIQQFENDMSMAPELIQRARQALHEEFDVNEKANEEGTFESNAGSRSRCDAVGVPLGIISVPIEHTSVFPATDDVSASIKASQTIGILLEDWSGEAMNYSSFYDAGSRAQAELDRMVKSGRADRASSWQEVVALVGPEAKLTQLACIEKVTRLMVDMRRSGVNGRMTLLECICLPRISDVAVAVHELLKDMHSCEHLEMMVIDVSDAFYTLQLDSRERAWVCIKALDGTYILPNCVLWTCVWTRALGSCGCNNHAASAGHLSHQDCVSPMLCR